MGNAASNLPMSAEAFLAWDATQTIKHEFVGGEVFAMAGADKAHVTLSGNVSVLLVEVLSPSTAATDRGDKFVAYRQLPSLREYLLIDPQSRRCDVYRLGADGLWVLHPFEAGQDLRLASVELDLPAAVLWDEVPVVVAAPANAVQ
jgi:Uma2 family endonuclease